MYFRAGLRAAGAKWTAPFALALSLLYFFANDVAHSSRFGYAPQLVSQAMESTYSVAYALAAGLGVWESGRLRKAEVWRLGPARSRFSVAADALWVPVLVAWSVPMVSVVLALAVNGVLPDPRSLLLPLMVLLLCLAHAALGFAVGLWAPRVIAAPAMMVVVWILVAFSVAVDPPWLRHLSGNYTAGLGYGEHFQLIVLVPHLLFTGGIALGAVLLWLPLRPRLVSLVLALAAAVSGPVVATNIVEGWSYTPPLLARQVPFQCLGERPKVCVPSDVAGQLPAVRAGVVAVLDDLREAGIQRRPAALYRDSLGSGRFGGSNEGGERKLNLSSAERNGTLRYQVLRDIVRFPCARGDAAAAHRALLWAAQVTGTEKQYRDRLHPALSRARHEEESRRVVREVRSRPPEDQGAWFERTVARACRARVA
jgi:hypothetical protein